MAGHSYLQIKANPALRNLDVFTISLWFKTRSNYAQIIEPIAKPTYDEATDTYYSNPPFSLACDSEGYLKFSIGGERIRSSRNQLNNNAWHHALVVKAGRNISLYIDGEPAASQRVRTDVNSNDLDWVIGSLNSWGNRYSGQMDEVVILATEVTAQEAKTIYQSQR